MACPECGSDAETGWNDDALSGYTAADVPDEFTEEDYEAAIRGLPRPGESRSPSMSPRQWFVFVVGVLIALAMVLVYVL